MNGHHGPVIAERAGLRVIDCRACGWAHLDPLPSAEELAAYYTDEFWQKDKADWLARYEAQRDWDEMRANDWLTIAEGLTAGRTLLDVGSGYGQFIEAAGKRGWTATGIEPSTAAAEYARGRGLTVSCADWRQLREAEEDRGAWAIDGALAALWVLEHMPDPEEFLRWARTRAKLLILAVPNEFSRDQAGANDFAAVKDWFVHKTHCNYFTPATIGNLLGRAGFVIVDMLSTYPMEHFIGAVGKDYTADPAIGDQCHAGIRQWELGITQDERFRTYRALARHGVGRDLIIFARPA